MRVSNFGRVISRIESANVCKSFYSYSNDIYISATVCRIAVICLGIPSIDFSYEYSQLSDIFLGKNELVSKVNRELI